MTFRRHTRHSCIYIPFQNDRLLLFTKRLLTLFLISFIFVANTKKTSRNFWIKIRITMWKMPVPLIINCLFGVCSIHLSLYGNEKETFFWIDINTNDKSKITINKLPSFILFFCCATCTFLIISQWMNSILKYLCRLTKKFY